MIRSATPADAAAIAGIYNHYITDTIVTFEETTVTGDEMAERIAAVLADGHPWLVAEEQGVVLGYAYASTWKGRCAYRFTLETTVYLRHGASGRGMGSALYAALLARLREMNIHVAVGCLALPNEDSVRLHEKLGFRKVAHFTEVGYKFERWLDVGFWELRL